MKLPALPLVLSLLLAACGGKVVVDPVEVPAPKCEDVCNKSIAACGGTMEDCAQSCAQSDKIFSNVCSDEWSAFLACVDDNPNAQCQGTSACDGEVNAMTSCIATECASNPQACIP